MGSGIPVMLAMSHKMAYNSEGTEVLFIRRYAGDALAKGETNEKGFYWGMAPE